MSVSITITSSLPAGSYTDFAGGTLPFGFLLCNGDVVSRTTYARLFEAIGTTYGAGDGSTTFKLPDFRGRVSVGAGTGSSLTARTLAATGGEENHILSTAEMPSHTHIQDAHSHSIPVARAGGGAASDELALRTSGATSTLGNNTGSATATNQYTGGGAGHNNMQPFLVANKIIKF